MGVFTLVFLAALVLGTVLAVWSNSGRYVSTEMDRAGFGILTAWVSDVPDLDSLAALHADHGTAHKRVLVEALYRKGDISACTIGSTIEADYRNMGILKTVGFTSGTLRRLQLLQYGMAILSVWR